MTEAASEAGPPDSPSCFVFLALFISISNCMRVASLALLADEVDDISRPADGAEAPHPEAVAHAPDREGLPTYANPEVSRLHHQRATLQRDRETGRQGDGERERRSYTQSNGKKETDKRHTDRKTDRQLRQKQKCARMKTSHRPWCF